MLLSSKGQAYARSMPSRRLAGRREEGVNEDMCLYIIKTSIHSVVFGEESLSLLWKIQGYFY
jgi:hypothetical protein